MSAIFVGWLVCSAGLIGVIVGFLIGRDRREISAFEVYAGVFYGAVGALVLAMAAGLLASA